MKIHLDTDIGGDIDDLCALVMLLKWPGVEITGITTVAEVDSKRAGYVRHVLHEDKIGKTYHNVPDDLINFQHDPLACAIAAGWNEGIEIKEIPLSLETRDGWLYETIDPAGKPTRVVTRIDGNKFDEFWLAKVSRVSGVG